MAAGRVEHNALEDGAHGVSRPTFLAAASSCESRVLGRFGSFSRMVRRNWSTPEARSVWVSNGVVPVSNAESIPVTIKFRTGVSENLMTYLTAGRVGEDEGCAAVGLHARTAAQLYHGYADWDAIASLKQSVKIPVLGNGDIWEAEDALRMMRQTGCDGVIVGRGCLGRPWLFRDLADVFAGRAPSNPPDFGTVLEIMFHHARMMADWFGERFGLVSFRRHASWYTKGFAMTSELRAGLVRVESLEDLKQLFENAEREQPFPPSAMRVIRGKTSGMQKKVSLPLGYLNDLEDATPPDGGDDDMGDGG